MVTNDWFIIMGSLGSENLFLWTGDMSNGKGWEISSRRHTCSIGPDSETF